MSAPLGRLAVFGLGLLGGSVALGAKRRGLAREVVGSTRSGSARTRALAVGAVDSIAEPAEAARGADLVVLATPVRAMEPVLRQLVPGLEPGAVVTDVGSVKAPLLETLPGLLPPDRFFVGSHPMAGGHEKGMEHAREDLFEGAVCIVTSGGAPGPRERVESFWEGLGARVVTRDAEPHDREVAWVSHLPHVLAFAFARALGHAPAGSREVAGPGFRDFTRIAHADPELWADILTANHKALGGPMAAVGAALAELGRALEAGDAEALERLLSAARQSLSQVPSPAADGSTAPSENSSRKSSGDSATGRPKAHL